MRRVLACLVIAAVAFCFVPQRSASGATVTLQQGSAGYSGCADTWIATDGYGNTTNSNYGSSATFEIKREHYLYY